MPSFLCFLILFSSICACWDSQLGGVHNLALVYLNHLLGQRLNFMVPRPRVRHTTLLTNAVSAAVLEALLRLAHDLAGLVCPVEKLDDACVHLARVDALRLRVALEFALERVHLGGQLEQIESLFALRLAN